MIKTKKELIGSLEYDQNGEVSFSFSNLADFPGRNPKLRTFNLIELGAGGEVDFHVHEGEFESYYILSGKGLYNDNGQEIEVEPGTVTFTPSGEGHGIKNIGKETLKFIALIVLD